MTATAVSATAVSATAPAANPPATTAPAESVAQPPRLVRNAAALMTSTVTSGVLTFGFWVIAARWFPAEVVGQVSALAAAMTLLASLAQLNLVNLYARFLPRAGERTRRLIASGYGASVMMSVLLTGGFFLLGRSAGLATGDGAVTKLLITGTVVASAIFFIQSSVLTALGRALWVPAVNGLTAAARLALLPLLAWLGGAATGAALAAWAVPIVISTLAVTWWVLARGAPQHARSHTAAAAAPRREVLGFASAEYVNGLLSNAVAFLPPVVVAGVLGAESGAYFYLPWLVGVSALTLLWNVVTSFVVEASRDGTRARAHLHRTIAMVLAVVVPGALVLVLAAEPLLSLLGPAYAANGATALRLIGLTLPLFGIVLLYSAFAMMEKRMWRLVAVQTAGVLILFAGIWLGLDRLGLVAPAAALLVSQAVVALGVLPAVIRRYRQVGASGAAPAWMRGTT